MKPTFAFLIAMAFFVAFAAAQKTVSDDALQDTLLTLSRNFMNDWQKHDMAQLADSLAPDFLYVSPRGVAPRAGVVAALTHCSLLSFSISDVQLRQTSPDTATLIYTLHQNDDCTGKPLPRTSRNTDGFVRQNHRWLFVLTTETPTQPQ